jgi:ribonuclease HI
MAKFYTDGSSTKGIKSANCVTDDKGKVLVITETIGEVAHTSNEEEYRGVVAALKFCSKGDQIFSDSRLVVEQVAGRWKINKPHLKPLCAQARELMVEKEAILSWLPREENLAGKVFE